MADAAEDLYPDSRRLTAKDLPQPSTGAAPPSTAAPPPPPDPFAAIREQQKRLLAAGEENIAGLKRAAAPLLAQESRVVNTPVPVPTAPTMDALPAAPNLRQIVKPVNDISPMMMFLALAGGALTETPLTTAFSAGAAYIKGITDGDLHAADLAQTEFQDKLKTAVESNTQKLEQYRAVLDNTHLKIEQKQLEMQGVAQRFGDLHTLTLLEQGQIGLAIQALGAQARAQESIVAHQDAIKEQWDRTVASKWQVVQDPGNPDKAGNPTPYLYNPILKKSETLNGEPYTPKGGMSKLSPPTTPLTPGAISYAGTIYRRTGVMPPMGMSAAGGDRQKIINYASSAQPDNPQALIAIATQMQTKGGAASIKQLTVMLGATRQALSQLQFNAAKAQEEMAKLGSSDLSPILNAIARGEEKWTGNPAYASLFYYMYGAATESARLMSGGQASTAQLHAGAQEEAKQWASVNMTPASWNSVVRAMEAEGANREQQFAAAIRAQQSMIAAPSSPDQITAPSAPAAALSGPAPRVLRYDANGNLVQ